MPASLSKLSVAWCSTLFTAVLASTPNLAAASDGLQVYCPQQQWIGGRITSDPERAPLSENAIGYPAVTFSFATPIQKDGEVTALFGPSLFHPGGDKATGTIIYASAKHPDHDYVVVGLVSQQILETYAIDLRTGNVVMTNTLPSGGIELVVDAFRGSCFIV